MNIVDDCFFVLNQIDSQIENETNTIWNDLSLTTKIDIHSKFLDLLALNYKDINTLLFQFIKDLYRNHKNEIDEQQNILKPIWKRFRKNKDLDIRLSCLKLIVLILKEEPSKRKDKFLPIAACIIELADSSNFKYISISYNAKYVQDFKEKYLNCLFSQYLKTNDKDVQQWESEKPHFTHIITTIVTNRKVRDQYLLMASY
ncbi:hypothetical protein PPL_01654 [Heterostelium album PN500]|uniref:Uncharacterized protein n=1 Tax=Heterostelium pallidum (strain ATCC 26659 / Pp 5 / PN500) TaxID=670386 RepID=D3B040_HETP5|nr:hypothetical protein PPL_01654 [Heterostelium album PN500]EFA84664.1 hypothetical protein PPL_01654 [Heterostelium album PN500]|eukprot:XP_020436777.1 hypothetical protein PPL_01654 [Heterostelium album PN500]